VDGIGCGCEGKHSPIEREGLTAVWYGTAWYGTLWYTMLWVAWYGMVKPDRLTATKVGAFPLQQKWLDTPMNRSAAVDERGKHVKTFLMINDIDISPAWVKLSWAMLGAYMIYM
jgi:hypothetical protein